MTPEQRAHYLNDHGRVTTDLIEAYRHHGYLLGQERRLKVATWADAPASSDRMRDNAANANAIDLTVDIFTAKAEIDALTAERDHIRLLLAYDQS